MKILCVSDVHGYLDGVVNVRNYLVHNHIHAVFLMGDYSVGFKDVDQNKVDITYAIEVLRDNAKVYALPGNCDHREVLSVLDEHGMDFHGSVVDLDGVSFMGLGGSNPTPFGTPFELSEEEIYEKLSKLFSEAGSERKVLITHFPPKDTRCDVIPSGAHVGSESLRKIIEEKQPSYCICSHVHESAGRDDRIGDSVVVNVGLLSHGNVVEIDTEGLVVKHKVIE